MHIPPPEISNVTKFSAYNDRLAHSNDQSNVALQQPGDQGHPLELSNYIY